MTTPITTSFRHHLLALLTATACSANAAVMRINLDLTSGKPEVVPLQYAVGRAELAVGGDRVVGVEIAAETLIMTPLQEGRTTVFVYDGEETEKDRLEIFVVRGRPSAPLDAAIRSLLVDEAGKPIEALAVAPVEGTGKVRLTGLISSRLHFERVNRVKTAFADSVMDLTELDPAFGPTVVRDVRERIGNGNIDVSFSGHHLFLQGMTFSEAEKAYIESVAKSVYPSVQSFLAVQPWKGSEMPQDVVLEKPLLLLECQLIEITLETMREMGVDWGGVQSLGLQANWSVAGGGNAVSSVSLATTKLFQLLTPHLQTGEVRLLYTQNLVCEDGGKGRFFAGGSFHIVATGPGSQDVAVEEVEYGIALDLEPRLDRHGNVETKVGIEFSNLGPVIASYPSILKRYVRTSVNVKQGQTLSLGALIGHTDSEDVSKIPGLGSIPVLGELFKSERYQKKQSELVVLITPRRIVPGGPEETGLRSGLQAKTTEQAGASRSANKKEKGS
jgi:Flp pilus assembly secretin CpaC